MTGPVPESIPRAEEFARARALDALGDLGFEVDQGLIKLPKKAKEWKFEDKRKDKARQSNTQLGKVPSVGIDNWESRKLAEWHRRGILAEDGRLLYEQSPLESWTLHLIASTWPHLSLWDRLAVLVDLDGVIEGGYLKEHQNIREAIEAMIEDALRRKLVVHLGAVFGRVADEVKAEIEQTPTSTSGRPGKRSMTCSNCKEKGHQKRTCPKKAVAP